MKSKLKLIALVAMALAAAPSFAQRMMMMGGGGAAMSPSMVLFQMRGMGETSIRNDVGTELKLTQEQKDKLMDMQDKARSEMMAMIQNGGGGGDREAMMKAFRDMRDKAEKQTTEILNADQNKRLKELWIQRLGNSAITVESLQKDLGVTDAQKAKIKSLQEKQGEAMQTLFQRMQNQEIDREQMQESMRNNQKIMTDELGKLTTDEQKAKLKEMSGAAFKFEDTTN